MGVSGEFGELLAEQAAGNTLEAVDERGEGELWG
jgi:hypothetical protein